MANCCGPPSLPDFKYSSRQTRILHQQNLRNLDIALVILTKNRWSLIEPVLDKVAAAVDGAVPGTLTVVEIADTRRYR